MKRLFLLLVKLAGLLLVAWLIVKSESRPPGRDSLRPAGAAFVSTMPAPSGDTERGY